MILIGDTAAADVADVAESEIVWLRGLAVFESATPRDGGTIHFPVELPLKCYLSVSYSSRVRNLGKQTHRRL